jgi:hypothetical protein
MRLHQLGRSSSPGLERPPHQRHDGDRRYDDQQKRDHAHRDAENQERQCCKHGRRHNDRYRRDDPRTPSSDDNGPSIALNHDHGVISLFEFPARRSAVHLSPAATKLGGAN